MKKTLLLLTSAALLLVGCAKEQIVDQRDGGMTQVTFTASLDNGVATKAVADGDGNGTSVNRCIMEIYYGNELFARQYAKVENKVATFTVQVVSNRKYKVAFWADKVDNVNDLVTDKYYTTNAEGGLQAITIKGNYLGNDDARDAFYHVGEYTVAQAGSSFGGGEDKILLKRPFAQMNVITTDWDKAASVTGLAPEKVKVTLKNALNSFNAVTEEASGSQTLTYEAAVYTAPAPTSAALANEKTLSMDYLFASTTKEFIDIDWKALHGTDTPVAHAFAAVPYQRNYRTNIKGALLTTQGQWTVTVDPEWTTPEYTHPVVIATTLAEAQAAVGPTATGAEAAGTVIVKPEAITNRTADDEKGKSYVEGKTTGITLPDGAKAIEFVLTPQSKKDVTFELPALPANNFYWYIRHESGYPTENLNVKVSEGEETRVIIDAPNNTHVVLNDVEYTHVIAITGDNTLVVPAGITVDKLTVKKGGVEIHGEVGELEITGTEEEVFFRSCEGLSATVFAVIKDEGHNYIKTPQYAEKLNSDGTYDIVSSVCKIGDTYYGSLDDAFKAVPTDAAEATVITVIADANETFESQGAKLNKGQKVILDLNGYKLVGTSTKSGYTQYINVENGAELTVKDSRTGGAIEYHDAYIENLTSGSGTGGSAITCHGCMTLESGTIENKTPDTMTSDLEGAIDMYTNAWGQAYSPADIVLNINGGVIKSNNANTVRLTSFSSQTYTTSVTANMNGGEVYGRDGFFIQGVSESYLNTNTLNLNGGKVYGTQAVRVMAFQNHANTSESKPVTIKIGEGVDLKNNYFAQSTKTGWKDDICIDNLSGTFEQLLSYVNIITPVCKIENDCYFSLSEAVEAASDNQTIELLSNIALDSPITISKSGITIDGKGKTIAVSDAEYWNQYKIGGAAAGLGKVNMISVKGSNFILKDVTLDGKDCRGVSLCTTSGGKDVLYQNVIYTGRGSGHYYGEAAGLVTFDGCKFDTHGYAVHFGGESSVDDDVVIKNCELNGWSSFGACKSVTISDSHFAGANDEGKNGWLAVLRPYCPTTITNCTFSDIFLHEAVTGYDFIGLGTGAATTVVLKGCKIVNDSKEETDAAIYSIVRDNGFDNAAAQEGSVFAFDATGNATDGYTSGTFYAKDPANIKVQSGHEYYAIEGKTNIYGVRKSEATN